ncbi:MAG: hypothetical protein JWR07_5097 [Nevskia sp.]|nr:hypothetical protein [Nevskia sp.]
MSCSCWWFEGIAMNRSVLVVIHRGAAISAIAMVGVAVIHYVLNSSHDVPAEAFAVIPLVLVAGLSFVFLHPNAVQPGDYPDYHGQPRTNPATGLTIEAGRATDSGGNPYGIDLGDSRRF